MNEQALGTGKVQLWTTLEHLNILSDKLNELFFIYDKTGIIKFMNNKALEVLGYGAQEIIGSSMLSLTTDEYKDQLRVEMENLFGQGISSIFELPVIGKDGAQRLIHFKSAPIIEEGEIPGGITLGQDITAYRYATEAQRITEEKLAAAFNLSPEMIAISSLEDGRYLEVNDAFVSLFGYSREEIVGKTVRELKIWVNPQNRARLQRMVLENPIVRGIEDSFRKKSGDIWRGICSFARLNIGGEPFILTVGTDITEKRRMEDDLLKASKLESLGILAGGLAHDFNNLLTIIMGNLTLSKMINQDNPDSLKFLQEAEHAILQARCLTQQLLTFARGGAPVMKITTIEELIKDAVTFSLSGSSVKAQFNIKNLWKVEIDAGQINQVINNLILNAVQAMPDGGEIRVAADNTELDEFNMHPLKAGPYIRISIKDQGQGIPEHCLDKIFDPYFTTKEQGTGLGLATAFSIINRHGGHLYCESSANEGACFNIYLPAVCDEVELAKEEERVPLQGKGRVLVMDDQYRIQTMLGEMLIQLGYEPELTNDGMQSIERYREAMANGKPFNAVIMDLTIPGGMGGKRALEGLVAIDPAVRVIVSSGYTSDPLLSQQGKSGFQAVLAKPYSIVELSEVLQKVIQNEQAS
ncbi:MAG: PAS domain S-box protein [Syntrophomonadaceae bacterium]|nr:PAS domain S-box protein [Syntrophomonadaceae bacterium]